MEVSASHVPVNDDFPARLEPWPFHRQTGAMAVPPHVEARVTRRLAAPPARVLDAWLDPAEEAWGRMLDAIAAAID
jgi:hypothetical protein